LVALLQGNNKPKLADYFNSLKNDLSSKQHGDVNEALLRLYTSGAINQYASFSYEEDKAFSSIHATCSEEVSQRKLSKE